MKAKKQIKMAKIMFKNSFDSDGFISVAKVKAQMNQIVKAKPQGLTKILKAYKRLIETALRKEEVVVESAVKLTSLKKNETELLTKTGAKKVTYKINPKIVLGTRITHGDWIYDETLDSKLKQITNFQ